MSNADEAFGAAGAEGDEDATTGMLVVTSEHFGQATVWTVVDNTVCVV